MTIKDEVLKGETKGLNMKKLDKNAFIFSYNDVDEILDTALKKVEEEIKKIEEMYKRNNNKHRQMIGGFCYGIYKKLRGSETKEKL